MSLQMAPIGAVPEETARVARAAFPKGNAYLRLRDELGPLYADADFAALFPRRGQPAEAPWRLALVTVFQFAEGLTDRQAAEAVRARVDWKYALGLESTDAGFDHSVLCEFRHRLVAGDATGMLLDALLARCQALGLAKARGRQRTDSTHVLAAIRVLNRLELVGETLRAALNALAVVAADWLATWVPLEWRERYGARIERARLPQAPAAREALLASIGADGVRLLTAVHATAAPDGLAEVAAVEVLRQGWLQQCYAPDAPTGEGEMGRQGAGPPAASRPRVPADLPPAAQLIQSPYDVEARYRLKRQTAWTGYLVHVTETCDEADGPRLLTHVETTAATTADAAVTAPVHAALATKGLPPAEHVVDSGYMDATLLVTSASDYGVTLLGPVLADTSWQAKTPGAFDLTRFTIDWDHQTVTCPQGHANRT